MDIVTKAVAILAENVSQEKNILKVVEECAELQEVLIKYLTKTGDFKPKDYKIVDEMGDVIFRIKVLAKAMRVEGSVQLRVQEKAEIMLNWAVKKFENKN